jgi:type IV pilus assembly protein PilQ
VQYNGLAYEENEDVIVIKRKSDKTVELKPETYAAVDSREVKISAVFFEMDVAESRKRGIDWKVLLSKEGLELGTELIGNESESGDDVLKDFKIAGRHDFTAGEFFGQASAMLKFFDDENLGEVIASPTVVVRDRNKGRIQVGSDVSVKQRDFAGNVIETFFPTGTIIEVTPYVYREDGVDYMLLKILVERSSFIQAELTTEIKKTNTSTEVVMLNGEETVLGGLFINEETEIRTGIPFLKDLPAWFFGLRYLFGSEETITVKKELVILLKTELLPTLKERMVSNASNNLLQEEINKNNKKIKSLKNRRNNQ